MKRNLLILPLFFLLAAFYIPSASAAGEAVELSIYDTEQQRYIDRTLTSATIILGDAAMDTDLPAFLYDGRTMVPARQLAEHLGATVEWKAASRQVFIQKDDREIVLTIGSSTALIDGVATPLPDEVSAMMACYRGAFRTVVPLRFLSEALDADVSWNERSYTATVSAPILTTIVLDAGHGGSDSGAAYFNVQEKDINLAVTHKLAALLEAQGYNVVFTRSTDKYVGLNARAKLANRISADLFVSLHSNAAPTVADYTGIYTYYYPTSRDGARLAQSIQTSLISSTGAIDRGIAREKFLVLRYTSMPAVLVEMGFMTNRGELNQLTNDEYQNKLAQGIAQGIMRYLNA